MSGVMVFASCPNLASSLPSDCTGYINEEMITIDAGERLKRAGQSVLEHRFDPVEQLALRHRADAGRRHLPVLEQHQRRNAAHAIL